MRFKVPEFPKFPEFPEMPDIEIPDDTEFKKDVSRALWAINDTLKAIREALSRLGTN